VPVSWTLDHVGILARSVEDTALVFQSIAGHDPRDYYSLDKSVPDCVSNLKNQQAPRLGLLRQYFFDHADEEMCRHTESVAECLRRAGAEVEELALPSSFAAIYEIGRTIMAVEAATFHQEMFAKHKNQYRPGIRKLIEDGLAANVTEYASALQARLQQRADIAPLLCQVDALLTPGTTGSAPRSLATTGSPIIQAPWSVMGIPALSLPTGLSKDGLPLAIQLVGPPLAENRLLAVAQWCERVLGVHLRPPLN